ncbi:hypothetical protein [Palleronia sp.]|uniref:hypothetical protein n=1 Tax=Palleronia sp. TaxID=1940284 RepID=UPI0035C7EDF2
MTGGSPGGATAEEFPMTPYSMVPAGRAWLYVPTGILTLQRRVGGATEQRVVLPNQTTMEGDNFILMRARGGESSRGGRMKLESFISDAGGLPAPFTNADSSQLQSAEDALGPYFFISRMAGPGAVCVLAVRPVTGAARLLPQGAGAIDVMMRNCAPGDQSAALEPIRAGALGQTVATTARGTQTTLHNLSPFAAPQGLAQ